MKLSKVYGLNPSTVCCFFCHQPKEIVLFGASYGTKDKEAPIRIITDYNPCSACEELFKEGTLIMEVGESPYMEDQPPVVEGVYPEGSFWLIQSEAALELFETEKPVVFISKDLAKAMGFYSLDKISAKAEFLA